MSTSGTTWRTWDEVADLFGGPADPDWTSDQEGIDQSVEDPWERHGETPEPKPPAAPPRATSP